MSRTATSRNTASGTKSFGPGDPPWRSGTSTPTRWCARAHEIPYLVVLQCDLLDALPTRLVAPLSRSLVAAPRLPQRLAPQFDIAGERLALKAHEAGTLFARGLLGRPVASLRAESAPHRRRPGRGGQRCLELRPAEDPRIGAGGDSHAGTRRAADRARRQARLLAERHRLAGCAGRTPGRDRAPRSGEETGICVGSPRGAHRGPAGLEVSNRTRSTRCGATAMRPVSRTTPSMSSASPCRARHTGGLTRANTCSTSWLPWREAADRCSRPAMPKPSCTCRDWLGPSDERLEPIEVHVRERAQRHCRRHLARGHLQHPKGSRGVGPRKSRILGLAVESFDASLQEVRLHHAARKARRFECTSFWPAEGQATGSKVTAWPTARCTRWGEHGNALLARWPIGDVGHHDAKDHRFEQRGLLQAGGLERQHGARRGGALRARAPQPRAPGAAAGQLHRSRGAARPDAGGGG